MKKAERDVRRESGSAITNTVREIGHGVQNIGTETKVGLKNLENESMRVGPHAVDFGSALVNYTTRKVANYEQIIKEGNQRFLEGKLADALFHVALDPLRKDEKNLFQATQESGWIISAGAIAASAYGGPAGAAAYASWQTYRSTSGNAEMALRAGMLAGFSYMANTELGQMKMNQEFALIKKTVLAGAIGGLAVAAAGGDDHDVIDGFILAGGMVIIQDGYKEAVGHKLDAKAPTADSYCATPNAEGCDIIRNAYYIDENGQARINYSKLNPNAAYVGEGYMPNLDKNQLMEWQKDSWQKDRSIFMKSAGKIPGFNAMALFHDNWVLAWGMSEDIRNKLTIFPALVMTYYGTGHMLSEKITELSSSHLIANSKSTQIMEREDLDQQPGLFVAGTMPSQKVPAAFDLDPQNTKEVADYHIAQSDMVSPGRYLIIRNIMNGKLQRVLVTGGLPVDKQQQDRDIILLSKRTINILELNEKSPLVQVEAEDLILVSTVNSPSTGQRVDVESAYFNKGDTLSFSDFDASETINWKLTIMGPGGTKEIDKFDNHWKIDLAPGDYYYIMNFEDSTQLPWGYQGFFRIMGIPDMGIWNGTGKDTKPVESSFLIVNGHRSDADGEITGSIGTMASADGTKGIIIYNVSPGSIVVTDSMFTKDCKTCFALSLTDTDTGKVFVSVGGSFTLSENDVSFDMEIKEIGNLYNEKAPKFKLIGRLKTSK